MLVVVVAPYWVDGGSGQLEWGVGGFCRGSPEWRDPAPPLDNIVKYQRTIRKGKVSEALSLKFGVSRVQLEG